MKIGVFDSGLGGLFTLKAISQKLPEYDYVYLGDTKRVPYGSRSHDEIYAFLVEGVEFLFAKDCALVIVACNTASAEALRQLQETYLPAKFPDRRVLGMIVPMTESCASCTRVGLLATQATVSSGAYEREFKKRAPGVEIYSQSAPLLVPMIESGELQKASEVIQKYAEFFDGKNIDTLLLGCTHYGILKDEFRKVFPDTVVIICQDDVVPQKTREYLDRHSEIDKTLSRNSQREWYVTELTETVELRAKEWFGDNILVQKVDIEK